jgi:hypothetical protein
MLALAASTAQIIEKRSLFIAAPVGGTGSSQANTPPWSCLPRNLAFTRERPVESVKFSDSAMLATATAMVQS